MIKYKNLSVTYPGGVEALKNINLDVEDGEFLIIVGLSGAGKSTLLRTTNGLIMPTIGEVYVDEKEITKAFVTAYEEQAESLFDNYLDHAEAYVNNTKVKDGVTNEDMEPDVRFLQSIEEQIGIKGSAKNNFRADITSYMFAKLRRGETIDRRSYGPLREAVETKLVASVRDISRIVTKSKSRDNKQKKKFNAMVQTLIEDYEYNADSAEEVIKFASNNLWRDS